MVQILYFLCDKNTLVSALNSPYNSHSVSIHYYPRRHDNVFDSHHAQEDELENMKLNQIFEYLSLIYTTVERLTDAQMESINENEYKIN
jgi:hypothetical protein